MLVAKRDLVEGTLVTTELLEEKEMPAKFVTRSVVRADQASYILNQKINVPTYAGDSMLWTHFEQTKQANPGVDWEHAGLDATEVMAGVSGAMNQLTNCVEHMPMEPKKVLLHWDIATDGTTSAVRIEPANIGSASIECFSRVIEGLRFPARSRPTRDIAWPLTINRGE